MKYAASMIGLAAVAAAHGVIESASIGGEEYEFYNPFQDPYMNPIPERISRKVPGNGPVEDVTSADLQCNGFNTGSEPAALHATVAAGSTVNLRWTLWPESHVGPSLTYMAKCPEAGCADYMPGDDAVWFKIQEAGREGTSNNWGATSLMTEGNSGVDYTIPECIEPGFYLVRHELIALHAAYSYPGAQFYPGCHQLEVTGGGSTKPTDLVGFPGAYSPTDPGVTFDAYKAVEYVIPGPKLFTCSGAGSDPAPAPVPAPEPTAPTTPTPTPTVPATTPTSASSAPVASNTSIATDPEDDVDEEDADGCPVEEDEDEEEDEEDEEEDEGTDCEIEPATVQRRHWDRRNY